MRWKGKINYPKPSMGCHIGGRSQNQDYVAQMDTSQGKLLIVCDGVGGNNGGAIASEKATEYIKSNIEKYLSDNPTIKAGLVASIENAHTYIRDLSYDNPGLDGMATTIVACMLTKQSAHIAHCGDSRLLVLRNSQLTYSTSDHSVIQKLIDSGHLSEKDSLSHPEANVVLNAIGIKDGFFVEYKEIAIERGDRFLLGSDGLFGMYTSDEVLSKMTSDDKITVDKLIYDCNAKGMKEGGSHDNIGIILYTHVFAEGGVFPFRLMIAALLFLLSGIFVYWKVVLYPDPKPKTEFTSSAKEETITKSDVELAKKILLQDSKEKEKLLRELNAILAKFNAKIEKAGENLDTSNEGTGYKSYLNIIENICEFKGDSCLALRKDNVTVKENLIQLEKNFEGLQFNKE